VSCLLKGGKMSDSIRMNLHTACDFGLTAWVLKFLEAGENVDLEWKNGETPLYVASLKGHKEVVMELLKAGAKCD